jgi:adenine phosphoribosyltransferase
MMNLKNYIREFQDFPKPGINFKDISPILKSPDAMQYVIDTICDHFSYESIDLIAGAESRGLIFGNAIAQKLHKGLVMVRKKGKLPGPVYSMDYEIEYGFATMEVQQDAIEKGQRVLLVDDLLATGGTAFGADKLVKKLGAHVVGHAFVIELLFLKGREKLNECSNILTLVQYDR